MDDKLKELRAYHASLIETYDTWDEDYQSLAKHFLPRKYRALHKSQSPKTNEGGLRFDALDEQPILSTKVAVAGLHGGMTSPARPWFRLTTEDLALASKNRVREWLDAVEKRMRSVLSRSNFYQAMNSVYGELLVFGTEFMFEMPSRKRGIQFTPLTVGEYVLDTNGDGDVDTVFRIMDMTVKNIVATFGYDKCSSMIRNLYDKPQTRLLRRKVVHAIVPRAERNSRSLTKENMPFASYHYEYDNMPGGQGFLRESGFRDMPGFGVRWDTTGHDVYGTSPAMDIMRAVKMSDSMWATYLKTEHKRVDPPMAAPPGVDVIDQLPGGVTPVSSAGGGQALYPLYQVSPDPTGTLSIIQDIRQRVREGLYNDLFKMLALSGGDRKTAREVAERHEEKLLQLGPVLERLHGELFSPLIDRTFTLMAASGELPEPPEELQGVDLKVDFISILAQAQKMVATSTVDQFTGFVLQAGAILPDMMDAIDPDETVDAYADYLGVEAKLLRSRKERVELRRQRAEQMAAQQAAEMAPMAAKAAKDASSADPQAIDELMRGVVS